MFIPTDKVIAEGWIKDGLETSVNNVFFYVTLDKLWKVNVNNTFIINHLTHQPRGLLPILPIPSRKPNDDNSWWYLDEGSYLGASNLKITVPDGIMTLPIFPFEYFIENGVDISSRPHENYYNGEVKFALNNHLGNIKISQGSLIGKIGFVEMGNNTSEYIK